MSTLLTEKQFLDLVKRTKGKASLPEFAKKLHKVLSPQFLHNILTGTKHPTDTLAKAFGYQRVIYFQKRKPKAKAKAKAKRQAKPKAQPQPQAQAAKA